MKAFEFVAFDSSGKKSVGKVEAWSLPEAKRKIQQRELYLASIKIQDSSRGSAGSPTTSSGVKPVLSPSTSLRINSVEGRDSGRQTSSYCQNYFSFFKGLKELFLSRKKISV